MSDLSFLVFSKKTTNFDEIFTFHVVNVKLTVKILSICVAFLENTNFEYQIEHIDYLHYFCL